MTDFQRAFSSIPALALLLLAACGGSETGSTSTTSGAGGGSTGTGTSASSAGTGGTMATTTTGTGEPMCTLSLYPGRPECQTRMDMYCCAEEKACAADPDCDAFTACLYGCAGPADEACLNGCGAMATKTAQDELNAIGHCSGMHSPLPDQSCSFP